MRSLLQQQPNCLIALEKNVVRYDKIELKKNLVTKGEAHVTLRGGSINANCANLPMTFPGQGDMLSQYRSVGED